MEFPLVNIDVGDDLSIAELAGQVKEVVGYAGRLAFDTCKLDDTPRKLLDVSRMHALGWQAAHIFKRKHHSDLCGLSEPAPVVGLLFSAMFKRCSAVARWSW